jgi:pyridoxine/pyridoxamine 5'-phosphate oxidase
MPGYIPWTKVDAHLRSFRSIWISTTRPDGRPHSVPLWYVWDGKSIYFITQRSTQKAHNLAQQPYAIIHAGDGDDAIILEGPVVIVTDPTEQGQVNAAYMEKYVDPHSGAQATIYNEGDDLYRVDVRHAMMWEYGVMGTRTDWYFD